MYITICHNRSTRSCIQDNAFRILSQNIGFTFKNRKITEQEKSVILEMKTSKKSRLFSNGLRPLDKRINIRQ